MSNLLESFVFLFESDASALDQGLEESRKKAQGAEKEIASVDTAASKLGASFAKALSQLGGAFAAGAAITAMSRALFDAANAADKLGEAATARGLSVETLSALGGAATIAGGSVEGLLGSLDSLDSSLAQIDVTGKSRVAPFLKELGIDLDSAAYKGKTAAELLLPLADSFEGLSQTQQIGIGKKLGLDMGTIMLLQQGRREIEAQIAKQKELGTVTKAQAEIAAKFNDQQDYTAMAWRGIWLAVSEKVLPALTWVSAAFEKLATFLSKHSGFITGLMIALGTALAVFVLPPLIKIAIAAAIAFAPFLAVGAIVAGLAAAFALLYEDVMMFLEGGDSLLGKLLERFPVLGEAARAIGQVFSDVWGVIKAGADFILALIDKILGAVGTVASVAGKIFSALGFGEQTATQGGVGTAQAALASAAASPLASRTSNSISNSSRNSSNSVQIGEVKVVTQATDGEGVGRALGGSLQTQMRQAVNNFDDGVAA